MKITRCDGCHKIRFLFFACNTVSHGEQKFIQLCKKCYYAEIKRVQEYKPEVKMKENKERYPCENYTKQLITDYLVPGMKQMLKEELEKIDDYGRKTAALIHQYRALNERLDKFEGLVGKEIIERLLKKDG